MGTREQKQKLEKFFAKIDTTIEDEILPFLQQQPKDAITTLVMEMTDLQIKYLSDFLMCNYVADKIYSSLSQVLFCERSRRKERSF